MKFSICNIAWDKEHERDALNLVREKGFDGIEITPSRIWSDFRTVSTKDRKDYLRFVRSNDLEICSMHSLFWGMDTMQLFGDEAAKKELKQYFKELISLAADMEIPRMVFGSPAVRNRGNVEMFLAIEKAAEFLRPISDMAYEYGTKILIEPLSEKETDFITNHNQGIRLTDSVDSKGFGLHLDAKAVCSEDFSLCEIFEESAGRFEHFHVNEPSLGSFQDPILQHGDMAQLIRKTNYEGWISIEMRQQNEQEKEIICAIDYVGRAYGGWQ